ncbi:MAG TPA: 30S ribosomal protein S13 [archaeon]|nr:30S ribosomal protein S13 [archaeon]
MTEMRYIVRIASQDLNGSLSIERALRGIKGIGQRMAGIIANEFEKQSKVSKQMLLGDLPEEMDSKLEEIVLNPVKFGLPAWTFNRKMDWETGKNLHLVMNELDFSYRKDFQRLTSVKAYRGLRKSWGLTVRGQRTKSSFRKRGATVGVQKKEIIKPGAAAKK